MTTLALLKAEIADDLARTDLTSQIEKAISAAIAYYQSQRFYFSESRSLTFATVIGQSTYSSADDSDIPTFVTIDDVFVVDSSSQAHHLDWVDPADMEFKLDSSAASGRPYDWTYLDQSFRLYPVPDAVYTIRPIGHVEKAAPATDGETGNVWMSEAYELIRCRAKAYLYAHTMHNAELAMVMKAAENDALQALRGATGKKRSRGVVVATQF